MYYIISHHITSKWKTLNLFFFSLSRISWFFMVGVWYLQYVCLIKLFTVWLNDILFKIGEDFLLRNVKCRSRWVYAFCAENLLPVRDYFYRRESSNSFRRGPGVLRKTESIVREGKREGGRKPICYISSTRTILPSIAYNHIRWSITHFHV